MFFTPDVNICKVPASGTDVRKGGCPTFSVPQWIRSEVVPTDTLPVTPGAVCDFRLSYGRVLSRKSKIIIVNRNRDDMLLNSDIFWKPQEAVQGEHTPGVPTMHGVFHLASVETSAECQVWPLHQGTLGQPETHLACRLIGASEGTEGGWVQREVWDFACYQLLYAACCCFRLAHDPSASLLF